MMENIPKKKEKKQKLGYSFWKTVFFVLKNNEKKENIKNMFDSTFFCSEKNTQNTKFKE